MKTLKIRCGPCFKRQIRALAQENPLEDPLSSSSPRKHDNCATLQFFQEASQKYPKEWANLSAVIDETAKSGPPSNTQRFNFLKDGIFEFKAWKLRLFCFFDDENIIICVFGVFKQTQRASQDDITKARKARNAYFEAKQQGKVYHA